MVSMRTLWYVALIGDALYFLWVLYNGIDEGFAGTPVQMVSAIGLLVLLALNAVLVYRYVRKK